MFTIGNDFLPLVYLERLSTTLSKFVSYVTFYLFTPTNSAIGEIANGLYVGI